MEKQNKTTPKHKSCFARGTDGDRVGSTLAPLPFPPLLHVSAPPWARLTYQTPIPSSAPQVPLASAPPTLPGNETHLKP